MSRIVLDTNVLISGTFWSGDSAKILRLVEKGEITLITSSEIIAEYNRILYCDEIKAKVDLHDKKAQAVQKITQLAIFVEPFEKLHIVKDDPDDNKFIEAAVEGNAEYIVSKDNHLLKLKNYKNVKIVTPEEFTREQEKKQ